MALYHYIWFALLASIISQCGTIKYYVKPTDFTNVTCPGQPCLSINEYTNDAGYYMKSNTVFTFLPGNHIVERPIVFKDVHNISLETLSNKHDTKIFTTQLMCHNCARESERRVQYCGQVCCSVIGLISVIHASINGLTIETYSESPGITGITIKQSYNVHIQVVVFCIECNTTVISSQYVHYCGIIAFQCNRLFVNGMQASDFANGIVLFRTSNTLINNSLFLNIRNYGMWIRSSANVSLLKRLRLIATMVCM